MVSLDASMKWSGQQKKLVGTRKPLLRELRAQLGLSVDHREWLG
jgi:hypothetical protein